jgi:hypothetical protein
MKIGFDVQYKPHDAVYAALRLSDSLRYLGYDTTLFSNKTPKHNYGCGWDKLVITPKDMSYDKWLLGLSHVIWPVPPNKDVVQKVGKSIVTIALSPWDCLPGYVKSSLRLCAHVVTPCLENSDTVRKEANIRDVSTIEWDSSIPMTKKDLNDIDPSRPKVLIPLHSSQGLRCDLEILCNIISGIAEKSPQADITISYSPKSMPWEVRKSLFSYLKKHKNIKGVIDETTCTSSLLLYGYSDIVLWPAEIEGFGLVGIESIYMGTPVVAYDIPPMSNIITNGVNGMLVPCDDGGSKGGVMYAEPNPSEFIKVATDAINEKILALNKNTKVGRRSVRSMFYSQWKKLIEG